MLPVVMNLINIKDTEPFPQTITISNTVPKRSDSSPADEVFSRHHQS